MKPISELNNKHIEFVFTDIDDTLTDDGRLVPEAYAALWNLHNKGFKIIPITGRPAGWCELIARQWPVAGVIGENGAFYFRLVEQNMKRQFVVDNQIRVQNAQKLFAIQQEILESVPGAKIASDQFCRLFDLAVDFAEDVSPPLTESDVKKIVDIFKKYGAEAKVSSIHVNGWFGDYDKLSCCELILKNEFGIELSSNLEKFVFAGDSPNDAPMFKAFTNSVGVANVRKFEKQIEHLPKYICHSEGGKGFAELSEQLLNR